MNAQRTSKTTHGPRSDSAGSGPRRRSSQPASSVTRAAAEPLPPLEAPRAAAHDPELERRIFMLVTAVERDEGMAYPPAWAEVVDAAKRRGYVSEKNLNLHLTTHGKQWLRTRAEAVGRRAYEMTKIHIHHRLQLKDLARDTGVPMQEAIGHIIGVIHEHRDELTRAARRAGLEHPWEGVGALLRGAARKA